MGNLLAICSNFDLFVSDIMFCIKKLDEGSMLNLILWLCYVLLSFFPLW